MSYRTRHPASMTPDERDQYRRNYVGADATRIDYDGGVVYLWEKAPRYFAVAFTGKAIRPTFHYWYRNKEDRQVRIASFRERLAASAEAKKARREAKKQPHMLAVGTILVCVWGYDQTNTDYYQVTALRGKTMVEIRPIGREIVKAESDMARTVKPVPNRFTGPAMRKRVNDGRVRINSFSTAGVWEGRPGYDSDYH